MQFKLMYAAVFWLTFVGSIFGQNQAIAHLPKPNLEGEWYGTISQRPMGLSSLYDFGMTIKIEGEEISGQTFIGMQDDSGWWGKMRFEGSFWGDDLLVISEMEIVDQQIASIAYWYVKNFDLRLVQEDGKWLLVGNWNTVDSGATGKIRLEQVVM